MMIDGPIPVFNRDPVTGDLTDVQASGQHYKTEPQTLAVCEPILTPYRVYPAQLQNVWAGDDPEAPILTIALRFPDAETAATVIAQCKARMA